jgi:predicted dinucleotide-binding enzyme
VPQPGTLAVLGTGIVGRTLGTKLVELGHRVVMGSRTAGNEKAVAWAAGAGELAGPSTMFLCGDDSAAKDEVRALLRTFGWPADDLLDLGDIAAARGMEMYLPMWLRLWGATGTGHLNIRVVVGD